MPTPITFHIYQGGQLVRSETLAQDVIKIGKLDSSHLKIEDDGVSRMHSVIEIAASGEVFIIDLGSATGTIVNGQRVSKTRVETGDQLQFGNTVVVVEINQAEEYDEPEAPAEPEPQYQAQPSRKATLVAGAGQPLANPFGAPQPADQTQRGLAAPGFGAAAGGALEAALSVRAQLQSARRAVVGGQQPCSTTSHAHAEPQYAQPQDAQTDYGEGYDHDIDDEAQGDNVVYQLIPQTPPVNPADIDSGESAVEVVILWGELSILHVEHLSPPRAFYVGEATDAKGKPATDFLIGRETLGTERLPIVVDSGSSVAVIIPQGASGDITLGNQVISIEDLAAQGQLQASGRTARRLSVSVATRCDGSRAVPRLHVRREADAGRARSRRGRRPARRLEELRLDARVHAVPHRTAPAVLLLASAIFVAVARLAERRLSSREVLDRTA